VIFGVYAMFEWKELFQELHLSTFQG